MKYTQIAILLVVTFLSSSTFAQRSRSTQPRSRTLEGTVVDTTGGPSWLGIIVSSGGKRYVISLENTRFPKADVKVRRGNIETVGAVVRVTYTEMRAPDVNGDGWLEAISVVEVSSSSAAQTRAGNNGAKLISTIRDSNLADGCGCYFKLPSQRSSSAFVFMTIYKTNGTTTYMNIDGRDTALRLESSTQSSGRDRRGSRHTEVYRSGNVTARVDYVVTKPSAPGEEVTKYSAIITVTKGDRRQVLRAVGECGC